MEPAVPAAKTDYSPEFEKRTYWRVSCRLIPFLFLCYIFAYIDRVNVGFAKLQMQQDLGISDAVYGAGAGIFFIGYFFFEVPCNIALQKIGAKYWLGPIMIVWGIVSACTMLIKTANQFYAVRFLLGLVESGFFPGVILYLTFWYTSSYRAKMIAAFMTAIPLSGVIGGPISGWILEKATSMGGLRGWQWLYVFEAIPSLLAGLAAMFFLQDDPGKAKWLSAEEKNLLTQRLREDEAGKRSATPNHHTMLDAFKSTKTWLLCFVYFGFVMGNYGLGFWLPQIVQETITKDPFQIGLLTTIPWAAAAIAMVVVGHHSDKTGERCWHIALTGIAGAIAFAVSAIPGISGPAGLFALTIATAGIACSYSTFWALPTAILSGTAASAGIAWINSVGNLAGYVSPFLVGKIRDETHSMTLALGMLSACCFTAALITILFFRGRQMTKTALK
ncbi:MAG: putative transporter, Major facilitator superfamily [Bryobacterales bacterium]|nr:putative transporter, Major facilitator superfamily [Bryobacterales bacterium]